MIGVVGTTHLGLVTVAAFLQRGHTVVCYEPDPQRLDKLKLVGYELGEPDLGDLIPDWFDEHVKTDVKYLCECQIVYIAIDCDSPDDITWIREVIERTVPAMRDDAVMVVLSQVPPGFTRSIDCIDHSRLFNQLDTLVFGESLRRALHPEQVVIGKATTGTIGVQDRNIIDVGRLYADFSVCTYEEVEMAKIAINCFLASQIAMTSVLADIAERVGADWSNIMPILRADKRIGQYVRPGLGIGGGHLLRDVSRAADVARANGIPTEPLLAPILVSGRMMRWIPEMIERLGIPEHEPVAILGLSYKPGTTSVVGSPGLYAASHIKGKVRVSDPHVRLDRCSVTPDPYKAAKGTRCLVIATAHDEYSELDLFRLRELMLDNPIILDPYGMIAERYARELGFRYIKLGAAEHGLPAEFTEESSED